MMFAHAIGIPHHPEELTLLETLIVAAAPFAYAFAAAVASRFNIKLRKEKQMPCNTIQTATVLFGKNTARVEMIAALTKLGLNPRGEGQRITFGIGEAFDFATGQITLARGREVAEIKRAYSAQIVLNQAKKYGWQIKETAPMQYEVLKR